MKFQKSPDEEEDDESDKHLEARDRRYSCLKSSSNQYREKQKSKKVTYLISRNFYDL